jgi:small subunit ribosomal protein S2
MAAIDRMKKDGTFNTLSKKERLQVDRLRAKLDKNLGSIADMTRLPGAIFIVDTMREHIAVKEAQKLNIPIFAMVDTNSDPRPIDFVIPANDDAGKSIEAILTEVTNAVAEGLAERKNDKQNDKEEEEDEVVAKKVVADDSEEDEVVEKKATKKAKPAPKKEEKTEAKKEEKAVEKKEEKAEKPAEPAKKEEAAKADDLTKVEGIGPKAAEAIVNSGIGTYAELAKADPEKIKEILTEASSNLAHLDPTSWPKQAKMAADGKWDELKEWQDNAKGGVEA